MASNSDQGPSLMEMLEKFYKAFERKIETEGLDHAKGYLLFAVFVLSLDIGIIVALSMPSVANSALAVGILVAFIILFALLAILPFFTWVIIPGYNSLYNKQPRIMREILAYQTAVLFIAIVVAVVTISVPVAISGIIIFGLVAFVYPLIRLVKAGSSTVEEINNTVGLVLKIVTILYTIFQLIIGFAHLL